MEVSEQPIAPVQATSRSSAAEHVARRPAHVLSRLRRTVLFFCLLLTLLAAVFAATVFLKLGQRTEPKPSDIGGPFSLVTPAGRTVTEQDLLGHWSLIYFGYTYCPDACPTALTDMGEALQALGNNSIRAFFFTVDPDRDTASALAAYLKSFDARIVGLTGSIAQTSGAAAAYHVLVEPQKQNGNDYLIDHSAYIYVMDPQGRFVDVIDGAMPGEQMAANVSEMMQRYL